MENEAMQHHGSLQRAIDIAVWMNFKYRVNKRHYMVVKDKKSQQYYVVQQHGRKKSPAYPLPEDYSQMDYGDIQKIRSDVDPLHHWEEIMGMFSTVHGELLRFIIATKIPLEKIIRHELASRGHDQDHKYVGFDKAGEIWLK